ncbi:MAG: cation:proton antiporter subunit C [Synergistaceae bacterium]|jgi:multicomponent Na+:H+ antiporter subunit C|nr:cation:proton antiporter subunit C [Synergistaceae bacterium]
MTDSSVKAIAKVMDSVGDSAYVVVALIVLMALYAMLTQKNLLKVSIAISVMCSSVNMFLVLLGYRAGGNIPIHFLKGDESALMVLPTPQCLTLTAIVIGLATTALMLSLIVMLRKHYGTLDIDEIRRLRG